MAAEVMVTIRYAVDEVVSRPHRLARWKPHSVIDLTHKDEVATLAISQIKEVLGRDEFAKRNALGTLRLPFHDRYKSRPISVGTLHDYSKDPKSWKEWLKNPFTDHAKKRQIMPENTASVVVLFRPINGVRFLFSAASQEELDSQFYVAARRELGDEAADAYRKRVILTLFS